MNLSKFAQEEEILFLSLSCFEVINIEDEDFYGNKIKVIRLSYLNKYKDIISKTIEEISKDKDGLRIKNFIEKGVNSKYSKGICKYLCHDFNKQFCNEITVEGKMRKLASVGVGVGSFIFAKTLGMGLVLAAGVALPIVNIAIGGYQGLHQDILEQNLLIK